MISGGRNQAHTFLSQMACEATGPGGRNQAHGSAAIRQHEYANDGQFLPRIVTGRDQAVMEEG